VTIYDNASQNDCITLREARLSACVLTVLLLGLERTIYPFHVPSLPVMRPRDQASYLYVPLQRPRLVQKDGEDNKAPLKSKLRRTQQPIRFKGGTFPYALHVHR
jgi:hypothetical protein